MRPLHKQVLFWILPFLFTLSACNSSPASSADQTGEWQSTFGISDCTLSTKGENRYFILQPGFQLVLEGGGEKVIITVTQEIREVDGHETRVIEEREWRDNALIEVSRNFFAICEATGEVFYFGEEVDMYADGEIVRHDGAWLSGEADAMAGLIMPGAPEIGMKYYQEIAPEVALDRAEVISMDGSLETPAGTFQNVLVTREGSGLNPLEEEYKTYAPEIGLIQDSFLLLSSYGYVDLPD